MNIFCSWSTPNGAEFTVSGVVILVTLSSDNRRAVNGLSTSFALSFLQKTINKLVLIPGRYLYPSTIVTGEGKHGQHGQQGQQGELSATFPQYNRRYLNDSNHFMLISLASGKNFQFTQRLLDVECKDFVRIFVINDGFRLDEGKKTRFREGLG